MNLYSLSFLVVAAAALFFVPRRWASLPLLVTACYMTLGQGGELGEYSFPVIRIVIAIGVLRVIVKREWFTGGMNAIDWLTLVWAVWAITSSFFHKDISAALTSRLGLVYGACGVYFLIRIFCRDLEDINYLYRSLAILLVPLAIAMLYEKVFGHNLFSVFGGLPLTPLVRHGSIRAQGPFRHAILAGTVGAVTLPLMVIMWNYHRKTAITGIIACVLIVFASASSGPVLSGFVGIGALIMWKWRHMMRTFRWLAISTYIGLDIVMQAPAYFLIARVSVVSGGSGYHRAKLIESAFKHLNEWWLAGTDYTRHWLPTGVSWSPDHTDITNHFLHLGVIGGLPLMLLLIAIFIKGFSYIGRILTSTQILSLQYSLMVWALGASLFAHAATCISVAYFDQSVLFLYMIFGVIASAWSYVFSITKVNENLSFTQANLRNRQAILAETM